MNSLRRVQELLAESRGDEAEAKQVPYAAGKSQDTQDWQSELPLLEKSPEPHGLHSEAPAALYLPAGQKTHVAWPTSDVFPAAQGMHAVAAAGEYEPGWHGVQREAVCQYCTMLPEKVPAGHMLQALVPEMMLPAEQ